MNQTNQIVLPYEGHTSNSSSQCLVRTFTGCADEPDVVVISAIPGQTGTSITNSIENICESLRNEKPSIDPVWVEHYPKGTGMADSDTFAIVDYSERGDPQWTYVSAIELTKLTGLPVNTL